MLNTDSLSAPSSVGVEPLWALPTSGHGTAAGTGAEAAGVTGTEGEGGCGAGEALLRSARAEGGGLTAMGTGQGRGRGEQTAGLPAVEEGAGVLTLSQGKAPARSQVARWARRPWGEESYAQVPRGTW